VKTGPAAKRRGWGALPLALALSSCSWLSIDPQAQIEAELQVLAEAGFAFEADVHFAREPYAMCVRISCAEISWRRTRRVIEIAPEAFETQQQLRCTLLEVWDRYRTPRTGHIPDLARGALRVIQDGPRVGITDRYLLREAFRAYRFYWEQLEPERRGELPSPDDLPYP
jgi:hypothetical protein